MCGTQTENSGTDKIRWNLDQSKEGVMFHAAFPEMFASLPRRSLKSICALVILKRSIKFQWRFLTSEPLKFFYVFVPDSQHEEPSFEVNFRDSRPGTEKMERLEQLEQNLNFLPSPICRRNKAFGRRGRAENLTFWNNRKMSKLMELGGFKAEMKLSPKAGTFKQMFGVSRDG